MRILAIADSGFGKSTGIGKIDKLGFIGLDPKTTFIISVSGRDLPFPSATKDYKQTTFDKISEGNLIVENNGEIISKLLTILGDVRCPYTNIVVDDANYIMQDYYMEQALKQGWDAPKKIGYFMGKIFDTFPLYSQGNKNLFFLAHGEHIVKSDNRVYTKMKTTGKMVDEYITPEGKFDVVLIGRSRFDPTMKKVVKEYITNEDEYCSSAKSPIGLFDNEPYISNDLGYVVKKINEFRN